MKQFLIRIPAVVQQQIDAQVLFIAQDSIDNALAWEARLLAAIKKIAASPGHAIDPEASERFGALVHKSVFEKTYLVHYSIDPKAGSVDLISFCHGARLPE